MSVTDDGIVKMMPLLEPSKRMQHPVDILPWLGQATNRKQTRHSARRRLPRDVEETCSYPNEPNRCSPATTWDSFQECALGVATAGDDVRRAGQRPLHQARSQADPKRPQDPRHFVGPAPYQRHFAQVRPCNRIVGPQEVVAINRDEAVG